MSDKLFGANLSPRKAPKDKISRPNYGAVHFIYLGVVAIATTGWLWFIARIAMWSIGL
jgi:hypothetical protein